MKLLFIFFALSFQFAFADIVTVKVPSIVCSSCEEQIKDALKGIQGIESVDVNIKEKWVKIKTDSTVSDAQIRDAIENKAKRKIENLSRS